MKKVKKLHMQIDGQVLDFVKSTVLETGELLQKHFRGPLVETMKSTSIDVVTQADKEAEALIIAALTRKFPDHHIVGEEGGGQGAPVEEAAYHWHVDPIDGTVNFANRIPVFCVSIALADAAMNSLLGVVYNPITGEMFSATRGGGAYLNDEPIHVSTSDTLQSSVILSGFPYDRATDAVNNVAQWNTFLMRVRAMRCMGSAALDLCNVACGRFDGYWEFKLNSWDYMAGLLCVQEAGGKVTDCAGQNNGNSLLSQCLVASNTHVHAQMLEVLAES